MRRFAQTNKGGHDKHTLKMKMRYIASLVLATLALTACDDTTDQIGTSLSNNMDNLEITTDTFNITTRSIIADSVLSRNTIGYIGKIKDPETGNYITGDFMTQFHTFENYGFPKEDSIVSKIDGMVIADSCDIRLFYTSSYGDSLTSMKLTAHELDYPMLEDQMYYSNFDPKANGYLRKDGIHIGKVYSLTDMSISATKRASSDYTPHVCISLNEEYTAKDGKTYNNYGTYIMQTYLAHPEYFKNSLTFIKNVVPGFYFENTSGLGSMAYVSTTQLNVYFRFISNDSIYVGNASFSGTEEVLQQTKITNDRNTIERLAADNTCTYLKTPAGIFTEMTLPIDDIFRGHESDSINTAKVVLTRINDDHLSDYALPVPSEIMMLPADSLYSFFENDEVTNNRTSYTATFSKTYNTYTFNNISGLLSYMKANRNSEKWNKVVLIPVTKTTNASTGATTKVVHDMSLTSTRLVGGSDNPHEAVKISVIYSKFK